MNEIRVGVIGCGYWGPNHIRNFSALAGSGAVMAAAADQDLARREHIAELYPGVRMYEDGQTIIDDDELDAVVIATPVHTHYELARKALESGKHVLVEKPFVTQTDQADSLVRLARQKKLVLMVGHTFEYTAAVNRIREIIQAGDLGDVLYIRSERVNLGLFQKDINVLWDLAPHDISILLYILGETPTHVSAIGNAHVTQGIEDVVVMTLEFGSQKMANVIVSWLDPRKVREMTIVGNRKMLVYDDISANEKIRIYDKGVEGPSHYDSFGEFQYSYRYGDIVTPMLKQYEPLRSMCGHFLDCIRSGNEPRSGGVVGERVTRILAAADLSLKQNQRRVSLEEMASAK